MGFADRFLEHPLSPLRLPPHRIQK